MESKVCSRSHGHPPGARSRSMIATARSNRSPVVDIPLNLNDPLVEWEVLPRGGGLTLLHGFLARAGALVCTTCVATGALARARRAWGTEHQPILL